MANSSIKPGTDYARLGSFKATAGEDLSSGDVVWVSARDGRRKKVTKAAETSNATGLNAALYVCVGEAKSGDSILISPAIMVTSKTLNGDLVAIAALSGGSAGDPVYLSTAGGITIDALTVTNDRIIGTVVDEYAWVFGPTASAGLP